jgi:hypothetical protein
MSDTRMTKSLRPPKTTLIGRWNPLLVQLEIAAASGASISHLVLQSLVAQSAKVIAEMQAEIERLRTPDRMVGSTADPLLNLIDSLRHRPVAIRRECEAGDHYEWLDVTKAQKLIDFLKEFITCSENRAEAAYERAQEGECFRGGEAAAYDAEQAWKAKRDSHG